MTSNGTVHFVLNNAYMIASLPPPAVEWKLSEVDLEHPDLQRLSSNGVVDGHRVNSDRPHVWSVNERLYERAVEYVEQKDGFDCCNSRAVTNNDGQLECMRCGADISEQEFYAVMKGKEVAEA